MPQQRLVDTKLPLAVYLMTLLGSNDLIGNGKNGDDIKKLVAPFYGDTISNNMSEELYNNTGSVSLHKEDKFFTPIFDNLKRYNFSALLKLFSHFFEIEDLQTVDDMDALRYCYEIMLKNRTDTKATKFDSDYCWKIAQMFLQKFTGVECLDSVEESYPLRRDMIRKAKGTLYIAGTTLKDAFSVSNDHKKASIIDDIFSNSEIKVVNIYLLNYLYVGINREDASKEIETSILNVLNKVKKALTRNKYCPEFNIILLSDFDIPFSLLTQEKLITRSTHLFTQERCYRGQYLIFGNYSEEYTSLKQYLDYINEKSYYVDLNSRKESPYKIKSELQKSAFLRKQINYKKIHPMQLENLVRSSFIEHETKDTTSIESYITPDSNQEIILSYLKQTEELLEKVVQEHDRSGWAKIIPSPDLGFPNNVTRIAGGFMTGALYDWSCSVPIVPIDATVNTCTSSVFQLSKLTSIPTETEFIYIVETIRTRAMDAGYAFNFKSGNHFITLAKGNKGSYYLVLHSSAKQSKESCFGLYPSERAWYKDNIKTIYNDEQNRYLRYIRGDAAVRFYDYSVRFREFNEEIHQYVAKEFASLCGTTISHTPYIKHHYGMPTASSIAIGTFVIDMDEDDSHSRIVPIFSDYEKDICLYQVSTKQERTYTLSDTDKQVVLVPHGWGQVIDNISALKLEKVKQESNRRLVLQFKDGSEIKHCVSPAERLTLSQKHVRSFSNIQDFLDRYCGHLNGTVMKTLCPVFCYCARNDLIQNN